VARDEILESLGELSIPNSSIDLEVEREPFSNPFEHFKANLSLAGGELVEIDEPNFEDILKEFKKSDKIVDTTGNFLEYIDILEPDITILESNLAVAENGAVWIEWSDEYPRTLLTLSYALAIVLKGDIVDTMLDAYKRIDFDSISYGIFLSGPSKTADIEQSLVFGAHGAVEVKVFLVDIPYLFDN